MRLGKSFLSVRARGGGCQSIVSGEVVIPLSSSADTFPDKSGLQTKELTGESIAITAPGACNSTFYCGDVEARRLYLVIVDDRI